MKMNKFNQDNWASASILAQNRIEHGLTAHLAIKSAVFRQSIALINTNLKS